MNQSRRTLLVDTDADLHRLVSELAREPVLAVDTEGNSFFAYRDRTCLVQVSTAEADFILDPLKVELAPFVPLLADPAIEKIFHACEYDVLGFKRDYGARLSNVYDTSIAAKAVGRKKLGLAGLAEEILGVKLAKDEQRSDWGRRPLSKEQVAYAYADTRHLIDIAGVLKDEVRAKGFEEEVAVDCERAAAKEPRPREVDPDAFERHAVIKTLDPQARRILQNLYLAREARAETLDKPPFRIVGDEPLGHIAVRKARTRDELLRIPGISPVVFERHGELLLEAIETAFEAGPLERVRRPRVEPDPAEEERFERLRKWRRGVAEARGVEVEVISGNAALKAVAKAAPREVEALEAVAELDGYRRRVYGAQLVEIVKGVG